MPLPTNFNSVKQLQAIIRRYVNKLVKEDFADLNDGAGNWTADASTFRGAMRTACTHVHTDSLLQTGVRLMLYYFVFGKAKALQPDIFGTPKHIFDSERKYKPYITLYFSQNYQDVAAGERAIEGEISFKLMGESATTITNVRVNQLATKIKNEFATPTKYVWKKGKLMAPYTDWDNGLQLQILTTSIEEAKEVITKVLKVLDLTPNWKHLSKNENQDTTSAYPENPGSETILEKNAKKPKRRPVVSVVFRYATLAFPGNRGTINLVDTTGRRKNPRAIA